MLLIIPMTEIANASPRQAISAQQQSVPAPQNALKDSQSRAGTPVADTNHSEADYPESLSPAPLQKADQSGQASTSPPQPNQLQNAIPKPVGTAAAPYVKTIGVTASRPAGAVIAPGKQRRSRSILIRVGVIVGAAAALGTVVALSKGSPSRPN
jgi:hypothetical protein